MASRPVCGYSTVRYEMIPKAGVPLTMLRCRVVSPDLPMQPPQLRCGLC